MREPPGLPPDGELVARLRARDHAAFALDADRHGRVVAHLAGCDGCERYVDQVRQTVRLVGRLLRADPGGEGSR